MHHLPISFWSYFRILISAIAQITIAEKQIWIFFLSISFYQAVQSIRQYFYPSCESLASQIYIFMKTSHLYHHSSYGHLQSYPLSLPFRAVPEILTYQHIFNMWCVLSVISPCNMSIVNFLTQIFSTARKSAPTKCRVLSIYRIFSDICFYISISLQ